MKKKLILASASPRRRELLETAGIPFEISAGDVDETIEESDPTARVLALAARKAEAAADRIQEKAYILGADTIVSFNGNILGKPKDEAEAFDMLNRLQGRGHQVFTGICLLETESGRIINRFQYAAWTKVWISQMEEDEIRSYLKTGEYRDKAGAYAIQGIFSRHIPKIEGEYANVVGLPLNIVYQMLRTWEKDR